VTSFADLPVPRGLDPLYFDRRRSLNAALGFAGCKGGPALCVDVGANVGQTLKSFLGWWPRAFCVSFEPHPEAWKELSNTSKSFGERAVAYNVGVSDSIGHLTLHSHRQVSLESSFRVFNRESETIAAHRGLRRGPSIFEEDGSDDYSIDVPVITLDIHFAESTGPDRSWSKNGFDLLKIDTQGWDLHVLRGASRTLRNTRVVLLEWQFDDIYGRATPIAELDALMTTAGFRLWDIAHVYKDLKNLRTLWADLVYVRA